MILEDVAARRMVLNISIDVNLVDPRSRSDSLIDKGEQEKRLECNEMRAVSESFNREENQNQIQRGKKGGSLLASGKQELYTQTANSRV